MVLCYLHLLLHFLTKEIQVEVFYLFTSVCLGTAECSPAPPAAWQVVPVGQSLACTAAGVQLTRKALFLLMGCGTQVQREEILWVDKAPFLFQRMLIVTLVMMTGPSFSPVGLEGFAESSEGEYPPPAKGNPSNEAALAIINGNEQQNGKRKNGQL